MTVTSFCARCGADFTQGIPTPEAARDQHICPKGEPCSCGHSPVFCHRLNAARYCPQDERLAACEAERDRLRGALEAGVARIVELEGALEQNVEARNRAALEDRSGNGATARAALNPEGEG